MSDRETLLRRISGAQFAAWELHIYLDTHPDDTAALKSLRKYQNEARELSMEYEKNYGPLMSDDIFGDVRWEWINNPWPWEISGR